MGIIRSKLENDLYKFSMSYFYMLKYPNAQGVFTFTDRNNSVYTQEFVEKLKEEIENFANLELQEEEFEWAVRRIKYIPRFFWEWYGGLRFNKDDVRVSLDPEGHLKISVSGYLYQITFWEVPILAMVSELKNKLSGATYNKNEILESLRRKILLSNKSEMKFSIFGLRRRFSGDLEDIITSMAREEAKYCVGTSNVYLAYKKNMLPTGTLAHELCMATAAFYGYRMANHILMNDWSDVFETDLGTMLIDTFTCDVFFENFTKKDAALFSSLRIDSGDEYKIGDQAIKAYRSLGINPLTKTLIFSNSLDFPKAIAIKQYFEGRIGVSFGIGGNLTSDVPGVKPSNIVMKLSKCRRSPEDSWINCIKISDDSGKHMGDPEEFKKACIELGLIINK